MTRRSVLTAVVLIASLLVAVGGQAQPNEALIIGTKEAPPFAMKDSSGRWTGLSIELWEEIALELGLTYEVREYDLQGLLDAVESGEVDDSSAGWACWPCCCSWSEGWSGCSSGAAIRSSSAAVPSRDYGRASGGRRSR